MTRSEERTMRRALRALTTTVDLMLDEVGVPQAPLMQRLALLLVTWNALRDEAARARDRIATTERMLGQMERMIEQTRVVAREEPKA